MEGFAYFDMNVRSIMYFTYLDNLIHFKAYLEYIFACNFQK